MIKAIKVAHQEQEKPDSASKFGKSIHAFSRVSINGKDYPNKLIRDGPHYPTLTSKSTPLYKLIPGIFQTLTNAQKKEKSGIRHTREAW